MTELKKIYIIFYLCLFKNGKVVSTIPNEKIYIFKKAFSISIKK